MRKLLSANFSRLWKDKIFWICMGFMLIYSVIFMLNGCRQAKLMPEYHVSIDKYYFHFALPIGLFCALFSSMFLGTEYSDGTIRNKIVVGHTRTSIYLTGFILTCSATLLMMLVWLIGALIAIPALGVWEIGIPHLFLLLLIAVMLVAALSAIFTFVSMLSTNRAITVAISILLFLGLLVFASMIYNSLSQTEMTSNISITADGMQMGEPKPNPNYVTGVKRTVYQFIIDFLPTGQGLQMALLEIGNPVRMLVSSAFIAIGTTLGGIFVFKRKNLK